MKLNPWRRSEESTSPELGESEPKLGFVERQIDYIYPADDFEEFVEFLKEHDQIDVADYDSVLSDLKSDHFQKLVGMLLKIDLLAASTWYAVTGVMSAAVPTAMGVTTGVVAGTVAQSAMIATSSLALSKGIVKSRWLFSALGSMPIVGGGLQKLQMLRENPVLIKQLMLYLSVKHKFKAHQNGTIEASKVLELIQNKSDSWTQKIFRFFEPEKTDKEEDKTSFSYPALAA